MLDSGARGATTTFVQKKIGDVHPAWENEAHLEVEEARGAVELVYPPISFLAEPHVTWVDANVKKKGTEAAAKAYLEFLYTPEGQKAWAEAGFRPVDEEVAQQFAADFPAPEKLWTIDDLGGWGKVNDELFEPETGSVAKLYDEATS